MCGVPARETKKIMPSAETALAWRPPRSLVDSGSPEPEPSLQPQDMPPSPPGAGDINEPPSEPDPPFPPTPSLPPLLPPPPALPPPPPPPSPPPVYFYAYDSSDALAADREDNGETLGQGADWFASHGLNGSDMAIASFLIAFGLIIALVAAACRIHGCRERRHRRPGANLGHRGIDDEHGGIGMASTTAVGVPVAVGIKISDAAAPSEVDASTTAALGSSTSSSGGASTAAPAAGERRI